MIRNTFRLAGSLVLGILLVTGLAGIIHTSRPQPAVQPAGSLHPSTTATTRTFPTYTSRPEETSALTRPEIITYTVQEGDTVFAIAGKFDLTPETIIWSNLDTLGDNPDILRVGMEINILPVDGVYYRWMDRDTLDAVAQAHGVSARAILDWPGNRLDATNPSIQPGTMIVIPGGHRHFSEIMQTETPREAAVTPQNTRVLSGSPTPTHMPVP